MKYSEETLSVLETHIIDIFFKQLVAMKNLESGTVEELKGLILNQKNKIKKSSSKV